MLLVVVGMDRAVMILRMIVVDCRRGRMATGLPLGIVRCCHYIFEKAQVRFQQVGCHSRERNKLRAVSFAVAARLLLVLFDTEKGARESTTSRATVLELISLTNYA